MVPSQTRLIPRRSTSGACKACVSAGLRYPREVKVFAVCVLMLGCKAKETPPPKPAITASECGLFLTKARPVIEELAKRTGMTYTKQIEDNGLRDCVADVAAGKPMQFARCVLDAQNETALHDCFPAYDALKK